MVSIEIKIYVELFLVNYGSILLIDSRGFSLQGVLIFGSDFLVFGQFQLIILVRVETFLARSNFLNLSWDFWSQFLVSMVSTKVIHRSILVWTCLYLNLKLSELVLTVDNETKRESTSILIGIICRDPQIDKFDLPV
jgi:hypothetical protein